MGQDGVLGGTLLVSGDLDPGADSLQDVGKVTYRFWTCQMKSVA